MEDGLDYCPRCHKRFYKTHKSQKYCSKCQGYVKQKVKTVICCDCGKEFEIGVNNRKIRCDECYKKERNRINRENLRKYRNKLQM